MEHLAGQALGVHPHVHIFTPGDVPSDEREVLELADPVNDGPEQAILGRNQGLGVSLGRVGHLRLHSRAREVPVKMALQDAKPMGLQLNRRPRPGRLAPL